MPEVSEELREISRRLAAIEKRRTGGFARYVIFALTVLALTALAAWQGMNIKFNMETMSFEIEQQREQIVELGGDVQLAERLNALLSLIETKYQEKDYAAAVSVSEEAISIDPENPVLWQLKGDALLSLDQNREAVEALSRSAELAPGSVSVRSDLALAKFKADNPRGAEAELMEIKKIDPKYLDSLLKVDRFVNLRSRIESVRSRNR